MKDYETTLEEILGKGSELKKIYDEIIRLGLSKVFDKYLSQSSKEAFLNFLSQFKNLDIEKLLDHRKLLSEFNEKGESVFYRLEDIEPLTADSTEGCFTNGLKSLKKGEWACATLAGGAGTRFFSSLKDTNLKNLKTKGLFPVTPVMGLSFLEFFCAEMVRTAVKSGRVPYWLIMTSSITHNEIQNWVKTSHLWGFPRDYIILFRQDEYPRLDNEGLPVVDKKGNIIKTGNGHGGIYFALRNNKIKGVSVKEFLEKEGIRYFILHNVDNLLARPFFAERIGYHISKNKLFTLTAVKRVREEEKMGIIVLIKKTGKIDVIEYSVCSPEIMKAKRNGELLFNLGHINTNLVTLRALPEELSPTLYTKKIIKVDNRKIETSSYEFLNQHLARELLLSDVGVAVVERSDFFLPTKSPKGPDSIETTRAGISDYFKRIFEKSGSQIHPTAVVEINPAVGIEPEDIFSSGAGRNWKIEENSEVYLSSCLSGDNSSPYGKNLVVEQGGKFIVKTNFPYGRLKVNPSTRDVKIDPESAGMFKLRDNVRIKKGVEVIIEIEERAKVYVKPNKTFDSNFHLKAQKGEGYEI